MSLKTLQIAFRMVSKKLFFTPKPPKGGFANICKSISPPLGDLGVSEQGTAFETASIHIVPLCGTIYFEIKRIISISD